MAPAVVALALAGAQGCSSSSDAGDSAAGASTGAAYKKLTLSDDQLRTVVATKAACPFVGAITAMKKLFVYDSTDKPVAQVTGGDGSVQAYIKTIGGTSGLLWLGKTVAKQNHSDRSDGTMLHPDKDGFFALEFPGSKGAHPVQSSILIGDPFSRTSGGFSEKNLQRLLSHAEEVEGVQVIRRSELGRFVAQSANCYKDTSRGDLTTAVRTALETLGANAQAVLADPTSFLDVVDGDETAAQNAIAKAIAGGLNNDVLTSSTEMGLLTMLLSPNAPTVDGEPTIKVEDVVNLFAGKKGADGKYDPLTRTLPTSDEWASAPKSLISVIENQVYILVGANVAITKGDFGDGSCPTDDDRIPGASAK